MRIQVNTRVEAESEKNVKEISSILNLSFLNSFILSTNITIVTTEMNAIGKFL